MRCEYSLPNENNILNSYEAFKLISQISIDKLKSIEGFKFVQGTIPAPIDGKINGFWVEGKYQDLDALQPLNGEMSDNVIVMCLYDKNERLYQFSLYFRDNKDEVRYIKVNLL